MKPGRLMVKYAFSCAVMGDNANCCGLEVKLCYWTILGLISGCFLCLIGFKAGF